MLRAHTRPLRPGSRRRPARRYAVAAAVALLCAGAGAGAPAASAATPAVAHLDHIFLIVEENNGLHDVIGNPAAPNVTYLAKTFGVATHYFGVNGTSEPNYVGLLGGSTFGLNSDDAYWTQKVPAPSLISQLDQAGISWKAYLQALPHPGYQGICYPAKCNGAPDSDPLYVSKHDGIQNFTTSLNPYDWAHQVPAAELPADLRSGNVPRFSYIVPDECHDMHGDPPYCLDSGNIGDPQNQHLVAAGDAYLGQTVSEITSAPFWAQGNNAIVVTYDSGDNSAGCCDASPGGGQVANIVITSHGPRGLRYATPSNHYSLLSTIQHSFGLGCLRFTCDTAHVQPMAALFTVTGSTPIATRPLPEQTWPTPTPVPPESTTAMTKKHPDGGGWGVQLAGRFGSSDNSVGAIAGSSPTDVWAVGDFLPGGKNTNQDATLAFAEHYDGKTWSVVPTPDAGPNFNSFYGAAASGGQAWAVGERLNARYQDRGLIEWWNGSKWAIAGNPQPGRVRDMFFGASALSPSDVWVVGDQEGANGRFETLAEHWDGTSWSVVPTPDPGTTGNHLYAVDAVSPDNVWAAGQQLGNQGPDQGLAEHWDGTSWSVVPVPHSPTASVMLDAVAATGSQAWVGGESDSPAGGRPLIESYRDGTWATASLPAHTGSAWTNLWGMTVTGSTVWAVGNYVDLQTDNNESLVLRGHGGTWTVDQLAPNPGSGSNILGGVTAIDGQLWAGGIYDNGGSEQPFIEHRG